MSRRLIVLLVLAAMVGVAACASMSVHPHREIFDDVPATIDPGARYLFHMHGWVVEEYGPAGAVRTGYWWRWTIEALADRGFVVISEARPAHTDVQAYALTVARQVARLRAAGVPSDHITVTGMSKGGVITVLTTAAIADPNVRFVVLAGCPRSWENYIPTLFQAIGRGPQGRVLSMYDRNDSVMYDMGPQGRDDYAPGCSRYFRNTPGLTFKEMIFDDGRGHALFYTPDRLWVDRVVAWALGRESD
jgi:hypothetical protein